MSKRKSGNFFSKASDSSNAISMTKAIELSETIDSCVEIIKDVRTIALPFSFLGRVDDGVQISLDKLLCSYRKKVGGVPIARGKHKIVEKRPIVYEDHPLIHFAVSFPLAIFRPKIGAKLPGRVVRVDEGQIVCSIYGIVTANVWRRHGKNKSKNIIPYVNDEVTLKVKKLRLFRRVLQLDAKIIDVR